MTRLPTHPAATLNFLLEGISLWGSECFLDSNFSFLLLIEGKLRLQCAAFNYVGFCLHRSHIRFLILSVILFHTKFEN
ncbi:hypothetical protein RchiOBHm_Chr7g0181831 [Rosa chinensis]|uniref:Uncharacterized protein n=1 Tax=Rosa chinensis TaxID=74649 RepID=A0A2P6P2Q6_ROSCH|nr:hypothetical protein RchiOBHm_Chr7g0181831 [Rosa chinensis]